MKSTFKNKINPAAGEAQIGVIDGKIPPQAIASEEYVLASLLSGMCDVPEGLTQEMFYSYTHQKIYAAIASLSSSNKPVDIISVSEALKNTNELAEIVGIHYLSTLSMKTDSGSHIEYHAGLVFEKYIRREMIRESMQIISAGFDESIGVDEVVTSAEQRINGIIQQLAGKAKSMHVGEICNECIDAAYERIKKRSNDEFSGITTGLTQLNKLTCGWQPSDLIILAARPAMGKTAIMLHFAKSAAAAGKTALIFSLEMSRHRLGDRLLLSAGDILPYSYRSGNIRKDDIHILEYSLGKIGELPIYIDDAVDLSFNKIRARAKAMQKKCQCDIVFIDYLQLCREQGLYGRTRNDEVSAMSREAKIIAKELNVPVILLSQLNREVEKRTDTRPKLSDLRDGGGIEQDADLVLFIHRPEYYGKTLQDEKGYQINNAGELIIAKNRDGACGTALFRHNVGMNKISDL
jgi:replicative DNA helicase